MFVWELAIPLTHIFNSCLANHYYPKAWKYEWITLVEKVQNPTQLKDLHKIALTSEFSLVFEGIIKEWITEDISPNIDKSQYGNKKGTGTEHLLIRLMDQILGLLDKHKGSAIIASMLDWSSAFDRQDSTLAVKKFLEIGIRPSLIPILSSYLTDRKMQVRLRNVLSKIYELPGGGAQGTLIGLLEYLIQSNDNADCVNQNMRFKYVDDLTILELVLFAGLLTEYDFKLHVASDISIDEQYISADNLETQAHLDDISHWTTENNMKLNEKKSNYMVFTRSNTEFATRLHLNNHTLDRIEEVKLLGVWITTWLE